MNSIGIRSFCLFFRKDIYICDVDGKIIEMEKEYMEFYGDEELFVVLVHLKKFLLKKNECV